MKLLTNGAVMVMIVGDRPYTEPVPLYLNQVSEEMDWEKQRKAMEKRQSVFLVL